MDFAKCPHVIIFNWAGTDECLAAWGVLVLTAVMSPLYTVISDLLPQFFNPKYTSK